MSRIRFMHMPACGVSALFLCLSMVTCNGPGSDQPEALARELTPVIERFHRAAGSADGEALVSLTTGDAREMVDTISQDPEIAALFVRFGKTLLQVKTAEKHGAETEVMLILTPEYRDPQKHTLTLATIDGEPRIATFTAPTPVDIYDVTVMALIAEPLAEDLEATLALAERCLRENAIETINIQRTPAGSKSGSEFGTTEPPLPGALIMFRSKDDALSALDALQEEARQWGHVSDFVASQRSPAGIEVSFPDDRLQLFRETLFAQTREMIIERLKTLGAEKTVFDDTRFGEHDTARFRTVVPRGWDIHGRLAVVTKTMRLGFHSTHEVPSGRTVWASEDELLADTGGTPPPQTFTAATRSTGDMPAEWYLLNRHAVVSGRDVMTAKVIESNDGQQPQLSIVFTNEGAARMEEFSRRNIGLMMAVVLDRRVIIAARIESAMSRDIVITGHLSRQELDDMARLLTVGALPAPLRVVSVKPVDGKS